jgi:protein-S-isoprenylcysteine O-methyltransferase Ste14
MEPIVFALSAALILSLVALAIFVMLWSAERKAHHAAKAWGEAEESRLYAYMELVQEERRLAAEFREQ